MRKLYNVCHYDAIHKAGMLLLSLIIAFSTPAFSSKANAENSTQIDVDSLMSPAVSKGSSSVNIKSFLKKWVNAYQKNDTKTLKKIYNKDSISNTWIEFEENFFQSINADKVTLDNYDVVLDNDDYIYVGMGLTFKVDKEKIPFYETLLLKKDKDNNYTAVSVDDYTLDIKRMVNTYNHRIENSDLYKQYYNEEKEYQKEHSNYSESIYSKLINSMYGLPDAIALNYKRLGTIVIMACIEFLLLICAVFFYDRKKQK